jgi:hypothetical protein
MSNLVTRIAPQPTEFPSVSNKENCYHCRWLDFWHLGNFGNSSADRSLVSTIVIHLNYRVIPSTSTIALNEAFTLDCSLWLKLAFVIYIL